MAKFTDRTFGFLAELEENNRKDWFEEHKPDYERFVREPALDFIRQMAPWLEHHAPHYVASDKKAGGSLMRVYRDTRFSKDKTPYKTNVGIQFRHEAGKDVHAPGFYLHLAGDGSFVGVGMWRPAGPDLARIRAAIDADGASWDAAKACLEGWSLDGESLKTAPRGYDIEHPRIEDLRRKDFIASHKITKKAATSADFPQQVGALLEPVLPFMGWLANAVGVAW